MAYQFKQWRYSSHPLTMLIDKVVDQYETKGLTVATGPVANDVAAAAGGKLMIQMFERLVGPAVRRRLLARGYLVDDSTTWTRKARAEMTTIDFTVQVNVKEENLRNVAHWLKAERKVLAFMQKQEALLGRPVTMGEFENDIAKIYASYGL
jgi:hypothetical protein